MCFCQTPPNARSSEGISIIRTRNNEAKRNEALRGFAQRIDTKNKHKNKQVAEADGSEDTHFVNRALC